MTDIAVFHAPDRAPCKGKFDLFTVDSPSAEELEEARFLCARCPAKAQCLDYALAHEEYHIWAGTTPYERKKMRRQLGVRFVAIQSGIGGQLQPCGTDAAYIRHLRKHEAPCHDCIAAHNRANAEWRQKARIEKHQFTHGTAYGYDVMGCRCGPCRTAKRESYMDRKRRQRAAEAAA